MSFRNSTVNNIDHNPPQKPITIEPPRLLEFPDFKEVFENRDLIAFLVQRDLKVRFQQTVIGVLWIVLQPLIQALIFVVIFGIIVRVPTGDVPYALSYLTGYIGWQLFQQIVNTSSFSLLNNLGVITKTFFPRLVLPISATLGAVIDFFILFVVLQVYLSLSHVPITSRYLYLPILIILTIVFAFGVGLIFGGLTVIFRDTKNLLGFIIQIWMFASPVVYPINETTIPAKYLPICYANPMTGIINSFKWVFLGTEAAPSMNYLLISFGMALIILLIGLVFFKSTENHVADIL